MCFPKGMHVGSLHVLDDLQFLRFTVGEFQQAHGNFREAGPLRGPVAPRSGDDFEVPIQLPHDQRREHAVAADALRQFFEARLIKRLAWIGGRFGQLHHGYVAVLIRNLHFFYRVHFPFSFFLNSQISSVLVRQKNRGYREVVVGDDPKLVACVGAVAGRAVAFRLRPDDVPADPLDLYPEIDRRGSRFYLRQCTVREMQRRLSEHVGRGESPCLVSRCFV